MEYLDQTIFNAKREDKARIGSQTSSRQRLDAKTLQYHRLIQNAESTLLNILAVALRKQDLVKAEHGLVAVLEWQNGTRMDTRIFENSLLLQQHLDTAPDLADRCRLVILQDLPRNHVEVIGSRLKIHPTTFARHWGDTSFLENLDDIVDPGKGCYRFMIPYPEFTKAIKFLEEPLGEREELYQADFLVRRLIAIPKPFGEWDLRGSVAEIEACLSFWAMQHSEHRGWDALIIVDPPVGRKIFSIDHTASPHMTEGSGSHSGIPIAHNRDPMQMFAEAHTLPNNIEEWWNLEKMRPAKSMFYQLVEAFEAAPITTNSHPVRSCGRLLHHMTQRKWVTFLNHAIHCLVLTKGEPYYNNGHFNSAISALWAMDWQEWLLARLVKWSRRLATERLTLSSIMRNSGLCIDNYQNFRHQAGEAAAESMRDAAEADRWWWIYNKMGEYKDLYDTTATSYIQVLQLREAQIANRQAHSVGTITVLGVLFVPISIVSGIMSMGGPYIPGGERFWIFFAVTLPILMLIFLCIFTNIISWVRVRIFVARRKISGKRDNKDVVETAQARKLSLRKRIV